MKLKNNYKKIHNFLIKTIKTKQQQKKLTITNNTNHSITQQGKQPRLQKQKQY